MTEDTTPPQGPDAAPAETARPRVDGALFTRSALGAWLGAASAALVGAAHDATTYPDDAPVGELWGVGLPGWYALALGAALAIGLTVGAARQRPLLPRLIDAKGPGWVALLTLGAIASAYGGWAAATISRALSNAVGVQILLVAAAAPAGLLTLTALLELTRRLHALPSTGSARALPAGLAAAAYLAVGGLFVLEPEVVEAIGPERVAPPLLLCAAATLAAIVGSAPRKRTLAAAAALLLPLPYGLHARGGMSPEAALALSTTANTSTWLHELTSRQRVEFTPEVAPADAPEGSASCFPGVAPLPLEAVAQVDPKSAPDIILVTLDAWRWDRTTWSGYARQTTPVLERWAKEHGVLFSRAYTPATSTRQTFGAYFTGTHPSQHERPYARKWSLSLSDAQVTLAEYLEKAGYHTVAVNKAKRTFQKKHGALDGFAVVDSYPVEVAGAKGYAAPYHVDRIVAHLSDPETRKKPKFVWTHVMSMHQKYKPGPEPYVAFGERASDRYDSAMSSVDRDLERLLEFVHGHLRKENTYLILAADHGHAFREHGKRYHGHTTYEEEAHVPLLVFGPGVAPRVVDTPLNLLALTPTILDLAGVGAPEHMCAKSLAPILSDPAKGPPDEPVYVEVLADESSKSFMIALIDGDMKLIVKPTLELRELYDLKADPNEKDNLAASRPDELARMLELLRTYQRERGIDPKRFGL
jgi:arylsulfatase A-like enzyme